VSLPRRVRAWDELFASPLRFGRWPYRKKEHAAIAATLPQPCSVQAFTAIVFAARWYMRRMDLRASEPAKPDPHTDIQRLENAVRALKRAATDLCPQALHHLSRNLRPVRAPGEAPFDVHRLQHALERFSHENRWAFERTGEPPLDVLPTDKKKAKALAAKYLGRRPKGGRAEKLQDEALIYQMQQAFIACHGGKHPSRGWPAFRDAAMNPLDAPRACQARRGGQRGAAHQGEETSKGLILLTRICEVK
jgi:hypothetical protein